MAVVGSPLPRLADERGDIAYERCDVEITVDLSLLRSWVAHGDHIRTNAEIQRVHEALESGGVSRLTTDRMVAILVRYAFLTARSCDRAHEAVWRMHAVDGVPADVLVALTWRDVRLHLRELAVGKPGGIRYFDLSQESCRLLRTLRDQVPRSARREVVFRQANGEPWSVEVLSSLLQAMTARPGERLLREVAQSTVR